MCVNIKMFLLDIMLIIICCLKFKKLKYYKLMLKIWMKKLLAVLKLIKLLKFIKYIFWK